MIFHEREKALACHKVKCYQNDSQINQSYISRDMFEELAQAHSHVDSGRTIGKVAVRVC